MSTFKYKRDAGAIKSAITQTADKRIVALKPLKIQIPKRFSERSLAEISIETYIVGICAIVIDDEHYGVMNINAMLRIAPDDTVVIKVESEDYYEFSFSAGSTVVMSTDLIRTDTLVYRIYDELISKGNIPWYLNYNDLGHLFDSAKYHAGANVGENAEVTELMISLIARDTKDRTKYYRSTVESMKEVSVQPPAFIPLRSVIFGATNTTNKLAGNYFETGLKSALVSPSTRVERIEALLTS